MPQRAVAGFICMLPMLRALGRVLPRERAFDCLCCLCCLSGHVSAVLSMMSQPFVLPCE